MSGIDLQGETEQSLVQALRQGRQEMLGTLYDAYAPVMLGVISRIIPAPELAEEVLKETFVAIWERIGVYDASKERLLTWGLAIARGMALEAAKADKHEPASGHTNKALQNGTSANLNVALQKGQANKIELCKLDPQEKQILELLYLNGRTCTEAADELNLTVDALKAILKKAFTNIKAEKSA